MNSPTSKNSQTSKDVERALRESYGHALASLISRLGDFATAEDVLHDAIEAALRRWPDEGLPDQPIAWLLTTAKRRAIDRFRRQKTADEKAELVSAWAELGADVDDDDIPDDRLRLIFTCCHPALAPEVRVALTLRSVGGLQTPEIARAFLVSEATMAQRLVRAKKKIKAATIPYLVPEGDALNERVATVLAVIYLIFNESHRRVVDDEDLGAALAAEAIRLAEAMVHLLPQSAECKGLTALMWFTRARTAARRDSAGRYVPLDEQDRTLWDEKCLGRARAHLNRAALLRAPGPYQLQAAIAAVHAEAKTADETNWRAIADFYGALAGLTPSPIIELNRAVVLARLAGPRLGLEHLLPLEALLSNYQPYWAAKASLLAEAGQSQSALFAYREAIAKSDNGAERAWLETRAASLADDE